MISKIFNFIVSFLSMFIKTYISISAFLYSHLFYIINRLKSEFKRRKVLKLKFQFQLPLQNIFPEILSLMMLQVSEIIDLLKLRAIVVEYQELPMTYLPEVINGEYICQLISEGVQNEPALFNIWPKDCSGILQEDVYILTDLELIYRDGDYKQFLVKPKRFVDVINFIEYDPLSSSHNLGLYKSTSTGINYLKKL